MCPWTPLSWAPHATQTKQPLAHLSLGGEGVWRPAGRQVEGTRRVRGRLQGQRGPAVPGSPACPILSWTPSRRCLQGQRWHTVVGGLTVDVGAARYLRAGRFIDLVPWKRHPDSLGPRPGRLGQVRQQGRGPCRGLTCGVRHPGVATGLLLRAVQPCSPAADASQPPAPPHGPSVLAAPYPGAREPGAATSHPPVTLGPPPTLPVDHPLADCPLLPCIALDDALLPPPEGWGRALNMETTPLG